LQKKHALQKKFVAVIGYPKSGKSTIIQSLSGCKNHSYKGPVTDASVGLSIYVHAASPQENPKTTEAAFKIILRDVKKNINSQGLVTAIQPNAPNKRLLMETMFDLAKQAGFESYAFILEYPYSGRRLEPTLLNKIKSRVQESDSDARVLTLDGRRFAILNAEAIKSLSRFPY
jgi:predicted kinase